ncbi:hypothetical protein GGTG_10679 [Gaeumannomyces tritici R3-111a-1]|uniref:Uncharacterized protein n=1 Tax=Gaeumannomyces tritici (strain R3-111a-1) TaxID=644352 RepID=J3PB05_GAET3|nr:hypothetical protein GGTG_10679 [Gaeumannomyces tritici R3-111a-1]EJT71421.1 hypothetical protein GGTG_10679 [Gaeumannomyces tritici R3-111a-1]
MTGELAQVPKYQARTSPFPSLNPIQSAASAWLQLEWAPGRSAQSGKGEPGAPHKVPTCPQKKPELSVC